MSSVAAIVVNFNAGDLLANCIKSLTAQPSITQVIVVDNASTDNSLALGAILETAQVKVLKNTENMGYAIACNQGAAVSQAEYLLFINPDCTASPDMLEQLIAALKVQSKAALAGPRVQNPDHSQQRASRRRFPNPQRALMTFTGLDRWADRWPALQGVELQSAVDDEPVIAEAVSGACFLIRDQVFQQLGGFDEGYRLHCEDLDLMYRLSQSGWFSVFVPKALATHVQGVSSRSRPVWVHWQKHRGMLRFFNKFQAEQTAFPLRWLVRAGIWLRCVLTVPLVWLRA